MEPTIQSSVQNVHRMVDALLELVTAEHPRRLRVVERELWKGLLRLGAALIAVFLQRQASRDRPVEYMHDRIAWRLADVAITDVGTLFGKVRFERRAGRRVDNPRAKRDLPVDRELGLVGGFSQSVVLEMTRLVGQVAYGGALEAFKRVHGWAPAPRTLMRMVDAVGPLVRRYWDSAAAALVGDGEILAFEFDFKGVPMIGHRELQRRRQPHGAKERSRTRRHQRKERRRRHPRKRRGPGEKSKNARMGLVVVVYTLKRTPFGMEGPINKRAYVTFNGLEALVHLVKRQLEIRGLGKEILFLADGQDALWDFQRKYFPKARTVIDWWHVAEKIWEAASLMFGPGNPASKPFVDDLLRHLRAGRVETVIEVMTEAHRGISPNGPGNPWRRKRLANITKYLVNHKDRMHYLGLRRDDLPIGTGVVEGAVRHILGTRLDNSGMRWSRDRAEMVALLRCVLVNGEWDAFEAFVENQSTSNLSAVPLPTRPYDAEPRDAA